MTLPAAYELSVVIPAYNEETIICQTVQAITDDLAARGITHEILVVDDGSTDHTKEQVQGLVGRMGSHLRLVQTHHQGKGGAVRSGVLAARGAFILFMDADHSTRIEE
ncbi:MAG: glycosyltransferase, partial [Candidatus Omnitrophota bacterium]|nr:glycosyltransferase [Candidatus Omnitrophota bacterium]